MLCALGQLVGGAIQITVVIVIVESRCGHGRTLWETGGRGQVPPNLEWGHANPNCPPYLNKIPLRINPNTPFQAKFFLRRDGLTSRPKPNLLDLPLRPPWFQPDLFHRMWHFYVGVLLKYESDKELCCFFLIRFISNKRRPGPNDSLIFWTDFWTQC